MSKYDHIQEAAYKANMQLPQLGPGTFYIRQCKCSRQKPGCFRHQTQRCPI